MSTSAWVKRATEGGLPVSDRTGFVVTGKADRPKAEQPERLSQTAHKYTVACLQGTCKEAHS